MIGTGLLSASHTEDEHPQPVFVVVNGGFEVVEGKVVDGVRDEDGTWDFDGIFTIETDDGERLKVHGWNCIVDIM